MWMSVVNWVEILYITLWYDIPKWRIAMQDLQWDTDIHLLHFYTGYRLLQDVCWQVWLATDHWLQAATRHLLIGLTGYWFLHLWGTSTKLLMLQSPCGPTHYSAFFLMQDKLYILFSLKPAWGRLPQVLLGPLIVLGRVRSMSGHQRCSEDRRLDYFRQTPSALRREC